MKSFQLFGATLVFFLSLYSGTWAISEQEAVLMGLERNPDIGVHRISLAGDSLNLAVVRAESGLKAIVRGDKAVEVHPARRYSYDGNTETGGELNTALGAEVSTDLPGGASLRAGVEGRGVRDFDSSRTEFSTITSLEATQPLLRDAWSNSPRDFALNVERRNLEISLQSFRKTLVDVLTRIRDAYLDWLSAVKTLEIRRVELDYAGNSLGYEKARYLLGEKAEMDTLTAALEVLRAGENFMSAQYDVTAALNRFALELGQDTSQVRDTAGTQIIFSPLPSATAIMEQVKEGNADIRLLDITGDILSLQLKQRQNALLPRLDVSAGLGTAQHGNNFFSSNRATVSKPNVMDSWIGLSFSYDLLSRRERLRKKQAGLKLQGNALEKGYVLKQLEVSVREFVDAWSRDSARLAIRTAEVRIAGKNHEYALERYKLGEIDNLARLKAQNDLINARLNKLFAEVNLKRLEIAVDKATANVLNRFGVKLK